MDIEFLYLRNELKFRRSLLNAKVKIGEATQTEKHESVIVSISKKMRWKFKQGDKIVLDEFENQRFIDPKFVTLFTGYLTILDSTAIHTDREFFGTMPLPEREEVFNTYSQGSAARTCSSEQCPGHSKQPGWSRVKR